MKHRKPTEKAARPETPITDGDTRPDQNQGTEKKEDGTFDPKKRKTKKNFSTSRDADVNSLEDFKDKA